MSGMDLQFTPDQSMFKFSCLIIKIIFLNLFLDTHSGVISSTSSTSLILKNLLTWSNYSIMVNAQTSKGIGPVQDQFVFCQTLADGN